MAFLESYIKRKKRYSDSESLHELIDHLVTDFEYNGNGNLSEYLANNSEFIFNYKANNDSAVHWSYQRELWKKLFSFFTMLKYIPLTILATFALYLLFFKMSLSIMSLGLLFMIFIIVSMIYGFIKTYHKNKKIRRLVAFKYLGNIMSLPSVFLYMFTPIKDFLIEYKFIFFLYVLFAFGLSISGVIIIQEKRKEILRKYKYLLS